jgi:hypothetical protein
VANLSSYFWYARRPENSGSHNYSSDPVQDEETLEPDEETHDHGSGGSSSTAQASGAPASANATGASASQLETAVLKTGDSSVSAKDTQYSEQKATDASSISTQASTVPSTTDATKILADRSSVTLKSEDEDAPSQSPLIPVSHSTGKSPRPQAVSEKVASTETEH